MNEKFIRELNSGFKRAGYSNRSQFIRDAILEKLYLAGIEIPKDLALPSDVCLFISPQFSQVGLDIGCPCE